MTTEWFLPGVSKDTQKDTSMDMNVVTDLSLGRIVNDILDMYEHKVNADAKVYITDIPTFLRNRYPDEVNAFILTLIKSRLLNKRKEATIES